MEVNDTTVWVPTSSPPTWLLQTFQSTGVAKWGQTAEVITNSVTLSESLEPFPTYVPNRASLKHWLFLGCAKLVSLNRGLMIWGSQWMPLTCRFNFPSQIFLLIFLFAKSLSLGPGKLWLKPFDICQDCQMVLKHVMFGGVRRREPTALDAVQHKLIQHEHVECHFWKWH